MISVESILAKSGSWHPLPGERVERVPMDRLRARRPFGRVTSQTGVALVLRLARGTRLDHGDLLLRSPGVAFMAEVLFPPVLEIALPKMPWDGEQAEWVVRLCHFLGNRHLPVRVVPSGLRIPAEDPTGLGEQLWSQWGEELLWTVRGGEPEDPPPNAFSHGA